MQSTCTPDCFVLSAVTLIRGALLGVCAKPYQVQSCELPNLSHNALISLIDRLGFQSHGLDTRAVCRNSCSFPEVWETWLNTGKAGKKIKSALSRLITIFKLLSYLLGAVVRPNPCPTLINLEMGDLEVHWGQGSEFINFNFCPEPNPPIYVNLLAIVILSRGKCGLSTCTIRYLVAMATADLLVIITDVTLSRISYYYFPGSFLNITPVCSFIDILLRAARDCSVWFTVTFSFDRFVVICCQKLKTKYCTEKTAAVVLATTCIMLCLKNVPVYFIFDPAEIIDNVPWDCYTKSSYYTEFGWVGFDWFDKVLTPLLPFALILLLNALTVRHILVASRFRKGLRGQSKGDNRSDPEMESRRKSVILLFTISGSFILLWLMYVIDFLYYNITGTDPKDYNESEYIFEEVADMLQIFSCCTNTFIYGVTQSKFREQLKSVLKYPVTSIIQLINKQNN
ncbi:probable G-protein coupled receptor 139 [Heterodontus francisci]|uniref:probable G-protein coupled receptor 139 n=1 Tax=Heterodontus francisci TaxID=7792 RepID=UPI00355AD703